MKKTFYTEGAYFLGIFILCVGTALMERADLGLSMVVAPAYLLHLKISRFAPFFTFGMAEYVLQAGLLILLVAVVRKFRPGYLFSFVTAVFYGLVLDLGMKVVALIPGGGMAQRVIFFVIGLLFGSVAIAFLFHTYISPEVYELFVKEVSDKWNLKISVVKTVYDCISAGIAIILSFAFFGFGHFEGVKAGTVITALVNGWLIGRISAFLEKKFEFRDRFALRKYFS